MQKLSETTSARKDSLLPVEASNNEMSESPAIQPAPFSDQIHNVSQLHQRRRTATGRRALLPPSHTSSRKWSSDTAVWEKKWERSLRNMRRLFPRSELLGWTYKDYVHHTTKVKSADAENARLAMELAMSDPPLRSRVKAVEPLHGRKPYDYYSMVLCEESVWRPDFLCDEVLWPTLPDMIYEGNGRMEGEGFGRRMALPRYPTNGTVSFKMVHWKRPYPFDDNEIIPYHPEDIYLDYDPIDELEAEGLIGNDLLHAIDCVR